jgi:hypothetical protein
MDTHASIWNATFYIPLPVKASLPSIGSKMINSSSFEKLGCQASLAENPPGLNHEGAIDVAGSEPWFVELKCDSLRSGEIYRIEITESSTLSPPLVFINTRFSLGNESVILPKFNVTITSNSTPMQLNPFHVIYPENWIAQQTLVYADYSSSESADLSMYFSLKGYNQWLESYDAWQGDSYQEWFFWENRGEFHGWTPVNGTMYTSSGIYPNPTHPEWQKLIGKSEKEK